MLEQECSYPLGFDDNKLVKEQMGILTYVQVCRIISIEFILKLIMLKAYVEKQ